MSIDTRRGNFCLIVYLVRWVPDQATDVALRWLRRYRFQRCGSLPAVLTPYDTRTEGSTMTFTNRSEAQRGAASSRALWLLALFAVAWPPIYLKFVEPVVPIPRTPAELNDAEILTLLDARRYVLKVPEDTGEGMLTIETAIDGVVESRGSLSVKSGDEITVILRRLHDTKMLEYCLISGDTVARSVLDDFFRDAQIVTSRTESQITAGEWLIYGGDTISPGVAVGDVAYGVRVTFSS